MASGSDNVSSLDLSAVEVKTLTGWPDEMVEDYLNNSDSITNLSLVIDNSDQEESVIRASVSKARALGRAGWR